MVSHKETKWRILAHKSAKLPISAMFFHKVDHKLMAARRYHSRPYVHHSVKMAAPHQRQEPLLRNIHARRDVIRELIDEELINMSRLNRAGIFGKYVVYLRTSSNTIHTSIL